MKYCTHCGKELLDEAVICPGCGCAAESKEIKNEPKVSTFLKNKKQWTIALTILFIIFTGATILLLTSNDFIRTHETYEYLHTDIGQFGNDISTSSAIRWQRKVDAAKATLIPYYIGIGTCSVFALTALIGDILLLVNKKKE